MPSAQKAEKVKGKFAVAPYPEFEGAGKAGILGGHNLVISAYSKNPEGAVALIDYLTSARVHQARRRRVLAGAGARGDLRRRGGQGGAALRRRAASRRWRQAKPRPVSPVYTQISSAIYKNVNQALSGQQSPEDALDKAADEIKEALRTP